MDQERELYDEIAKDLEANAGVTISQMFGKPGLKFGNKAFSCFFHGDMVFKLPAAQVAEILNMPGTRLFDPSGTGRAMKEWAQVPFSAKDKWPGFAAAALAYCKSQLG